MLDFFSPFIIFQAAIDILINSNFKKKISLRLKTKKNAYKFQEQKKK